MIVRIIFCYFSMMTYIHLTRTFITNPGYLPSWLKLPALNARSEQPVNLVRVYNMRFWMANKIHNFEEFLLVEDAEAAKRRDDHNIEINLNESNVSTSPTLSGATNTSQGFIEEETKATFRLSGQTAH